MRTQAWAERIVHVRSLRGDASPSRLPSPLDERAALAHSRHLPVVGRHNQGAPALQLSRVSRMGRTGRRAVSAVLAGVLLLAACGGEDDSASPAVTGSSSTATTFPTDIAQACSAYVSSLDAGQRMQSDSERASTLEGIAAGDARGTRLEAALVEMAEAFRRGDASIPETVLTLCRGGTTTTLTGEEADRQTGFLATVRAAADIADSDTDLLTAIDLSCDLLDLAVENGKLPTSRDQLMATAWAPLADMNDAEHVLRAGVPLYCPQHADLVERLL